MFLHLRLAAKSIDSHFSGEFVFNEPIIYRIKFNGQFSFNYFRIFEKVMSLSEKVNFHLTVSNKLQAYRSHDRVGRFSYDLIIKDKDKDSLFIIRLKYNKH